MKADILIRGGHVVDPSQKIDAVGNIAISGNRVIPVSGVDVKATRTIDASGCYVFPGLIDFHTHMNHLGSGLGANPDTFPASGVTSAVDAGSCGCLNFPLFLKGTIQRTMLRVKAYLSVYSLGIGGGGYAEDFDPERFDRKRIADTFSRYGDSLLGLKIRLSIPLAKSIEPLTRMIAIAEEIGTTVCVHTTNPPCKCSEIARILRKGDIFCHVYHGKGDVILDGDGRVCPEILDARNRGVIFDAAHGNNHFDNAVCRKSLEQGFLPDVISTDMTGDKMYYGLRARSLPFVMGKFLSMGMSLTDVIRCVTETPAALMGMAGKTGTLKPGAGADVSVFRIENHEYPTIDYSGEKYTCAKMLIPQMTIIDGNIAFAQQDFSLMQ